MKRPTPWHMASVPPVDSALAPAAAERSPYATGLVVSWLNLIREVDVIRHVVTLQRLRAELHAKLVVVRQAREPDVRTGWQTVPLEHGRSSHQFFGYHKR